MYITGTYEQCRHYSKKFSTGISKSCLETESDSPSAKVKKSQKNRSNKTRPGSRQVNSDDGDCSSEEDLGSSTVNADSNAINEPAGSLFCSGMIYDIHIKICNKQ